MKQNSNKVTLHLMPTYQNFPNRIEKPHEDVRIAHGFCKEDANIIMKFKHSTNNREPQTDIPKLCVTEV